MKSKQLFTVFQFNRQSYIASYENMNIAIYAEGYINLVQILDLSQEDVVDIGSSFQRVALVVLSRTHLTYFIPYYTEYGTINFKETNKFRMPSNYEHMTVSSIGDLCLMSRKQSIEIYKLDWDYRNFQKPQAVISIQKLIERTFLKEIKIHRISQDGKVWAVNSHGSTTISIWAISDLIYGSKQNELERNCLVHRHQVSDYAFRVSQGTISTRIMNPPNILLSIDCIGTVYLWVQNTLRETIKFFLCWTLVNQNSEIEFPLNFIWVHSLKNSRQFKRSPEYLCGSPENGVYTVSTGLPLVLGVLTPFKQLKLYRLYNALNIETQTITEDPLIFDSQLFKRVSRILQIQMTDSSITQILALDKRGNILKIQLNMNDKEQIILFSNVSIETVHSNKFYVDEREGNFTYIEDSNTMIMEQIISNVIPREFQKHRAESIFQVHEIKQMVNEFSFFFTKKRTAFFVSPDFKTIRFVSNYSKNKVFVSSLNIIGLIGGSPEVSQITIIAEWSSGGRSHFLIVFQILKEFHFIQLSYDYSILTHEIRKNIGQREKVVHIDPRYFLLRKIYFFSSKSNNLSNFRMKDLNNNTYFRITKVDECTLETEVVDLERSIRSPPLITKISSPIRSFDLSGAFPYYLSIADNENKISFFKNDTLLATFDLESHLEYGLSEAYKKNPYKFKNTDLGVFHLKSSFFLLLIDKYALICIIDFSLDTQSFVIKILRKEEQGNALYLGKFENYSYAQGDVVKILKNGTLIACNKRAFHILDDNYDVNMFKKINENTAIFNNLNFKLLEIMNRLPDYHPLSIMRLLEVGRFVTATETLVSFSKLLELEGPDSIRVKHFRAPLDLYEEWNILEKEYKFNINKALQGKLPSLIELKKKLANGEAYLPKKESAVLQEIIRILEEQYNNKRGHDPFACLFSLHISFFSLGQNQIIGLSNRRALRSSEVIWAFHSEQQQALYEACIPQSKLLSPGFLTWQKISQLCIPMWLEDGNLLRSLVEKLAILEYKETKDPDKVLLWYIILDKLNVLIPLYRFSGNTKLVQFLSNDFSAERWKTAAKKNAFVLLGQKKFLMAAAFFLLGDSLGDAVDIMIEHMHDLQLAFISCRVREGLYSRDIQDRPIMKKIIEKHVINKGIDTGDLWLTSIGYTMLGNHVQSVNCISEIINMPSSMYTFVLNPQKRG